MTRIFLLCTVLFCSVIGCDSVVPGVGGEGQPCSTKGTCKEGLTCSSGTCVSKCTTDLDCDKDEYCTADSKCQKREVSDGEDGRFDGGEFDDGVEESDLDGGEIEDKKGDTSGSPHIEVSATEINFGTVTLGSTPTLPFEINNTGNAELAVIEMSLTDMSDQKFTCDPVSIAEPIAPTESVQIQVTFTADDRGDSDGTLFINHNDPLEQTIFIQLHGRTPAPDVEILPDHITIQIGGETHTQTADIRIYNLGDEDLLVNNCQFENPDGSFSIDSQPSYPVTVAPGTVPAGPFEDVVVRFTKDTATVDDTCYLTFSTDDPDEKTFVVTVVGKYTP